MNAHEALARARLITGQAREQLATLKAKAQAARVELDPDFIAQAEANLANMERAVAGLELSASVWSDVGALVDRMTAALEEPAAPPKEEPWVN